MSCWRAREYEQVHRPDVLRLCKKRLCVVETALCCDGTGSAVCRIGRFDRDLCHIIVVLSASGSSRFAGC
ncbi:MAG: hypothetical protein IJI61_05125 [Oscillospiraceae bacterium]|nr:hypothetical protein [Oscillospiraceae bacterium]